MSSRAVQPPAAVVELVPGVSAAAPGMLWLHRARALVAADVHLAYEDVIGGALPTWSTPEIIGSLLVVARAVSAREIILLGDVIHGSRMSDGACTAVRAGLDALRDCAELTIVAGNHEGRTRGADVLGATVERVERDGWNLLHGDRVEPCARAVIGHLHPSIPLDAGSTAPAFLASARVIVLPALTAYSSGLNVLSSECLQALRPWGVASRNDLHVVAAAGDVLYPFGKLGELRAAMATGRAPRSPYRRKYLRPD